LAGWARERLRAAAVHLEIQFSRKMKSIESAEVRRCAVEELLSARRRHVVVFVAFVVVDWSSSSSDRFYFQL
jgi:hypothetical protein